MQPLRALNESWEHCCETTITLFSSFLKREMYYLNSRSSFVLFNPRFTLPVTRAFSSKEKEQLISSKFHVIRICVKQAKFIEIKTVTGHRQKISSCCQQLNIKWAQLYYTLGGGVEGGCAGG